MYIPCFASIHPPTLSTSFTLQIQIDPKKITKRFKQFKYNKYMNEFGFIDESGVEYLVYCFKHGDEKHSSWGTVVTISDSLNPEKDINKFFYWMSDNFGLNT